MYLLNLTKKKASFNEEIDKGTHLAKAAFESAENQFQKSIFGKCMRLAVTENTIFRKMISGWPLISPLTRKWISSLIFTSIHFRVCKTQREGEKKQKTQHESERERTKKKQSKNTTANERDQVRMRSSQRTRSMPTSEIKCESSDRSSHPELRSSQRARERTRANDPQTDTDLPHTGHAELCQTITAPNAADPRLVTAQTHTDPDQGTRSSSASRSPVQAFRSPSQTQTHGEFFGTGWPPHTHLTSDPHVRSTHSLTSDPLTSPVQPILPIRSLKYIYIYMYIFI